MFRAAVRSQYRQFLKRQLSTTPKNSSTEVPSVKANGPGGNGSGSGGSKKQGSSFGRNLALSVFVATSITVTNASYQLRNDKKFAKEVEEKYPLLYQLLSNVDKVLPVGTFKLNDEQKSNLRDLYVAEDVKEGLLDPVQHNYEEKLPEPTSSVSDSEKATAMSDAVEGEAQLVDEVLVVPAVDSMDKIESSTTTIASEPSTAASASSTTGSPVSTASVEEDVTTSTPAPVPTPARKRPSMKMAISRSAEADTLAALAEESNQQLQALRQEFEKKLLTDVQNMSAEELRLRVIQLNTELVERSKWEGLRLQNSIQKVEQELTTAYHMLLEQQEKDLVEELNEKLATQESIYQLELATRLGEFSTQSELKSEAVLAEEKKKYEQALEAEKARIQEETTKDLQQDLNNQVALLRNEQIQQLVAVQKDVESLKMKLSVYDIAAGDIEDLTKRSAAAHKETAVLLALENSLSQPSKSFKNELAAAKEFAKNSQNSQLLSVVLDSIPSQLADTTTPPSWQEIKYRFQIVREELRKEALAPPAMKGLLGAAIGTTLATLSSPPEGNIPGDGVEETLARVQFNLDKGMWAKAYAEAATIKGYSHALAKDWIKLVEARLIVDQTLQVLRSDLIVNHASLGASK